MNLILNFNEGQLTQEQLDQCLVTLAIDACTVEHIPVTGIDDVYPVMDRVQNVFTNYALDQMFRGEINPDNKVFVILPRDAMLAVFVMGYMFDLVGQHIPTLVVSDKDVEVVY